MKNKKNTQIIKKNFCHILGCCLLCCKDLIRNKLLKSLKEHIFIVPLKVILYIIGLFKMKMHTKIVCKRISDKIYNSFIPICDGSFIESEIQL